MTEMAGMLQLSRARFYQLLDSGFFPKPLKDERSKRPYYDLKLQEQCLECKQSGIGIDGSFMLFYSPRKKRTKKTKKSVSPAQEFAETLVSMGLDCSEKEVSWSLIFEDERHRVKNAGREVLVPLSQFILLLPRRP